MNEENSYEDVKKNMERMQEMENVSKTEDWLMSAYMALAIGQVLGEILNFKIPHFSYNDKYLLLCVGLYFCFDRQLRGMEKRDLTSRLTEGVSKISHYLKKHL